MIKLFFTLAVLLAVTAWTISSPLETTTESELVEFYKEGDCDEGVGWCKPIEFCSPESLSAISGQCPTRQHLGYECCITMPEDKMES